ncbi:MAG: NADH-quinone oxidoreductase subunit NuoE [Deltaproteobacteria bacterium]|nr:MAG: NADH-quinone oxidoreductase subunit NuoE [Deltaproteobacteria bacterium]
MGDPLRNQGKVSDNQQLAQDIDYQVDDILAAYKGVNDELIPILQAVQEKFGYLPQPSMKQIADFLKVPESSVFGVATFYAFFKLVPTGRNVVRVCRGTACHVRGGARILREVEKQLGVNPGESTPDLEYYLETVACIGACALAPTMRINDDTFGQMTKKKAAEIFKLEDEGEEQ